MARPDSRWNGDVEVTNDIGQVKKLPAQKDTENRRCFLSLLDSASSW